jgi:hypothetical protein
MITFLIVPAWSDQASQCRIVSKQGPTKDPLQEYRANPGQWKEAGLMNSRGAIVYLNAPKEIIDDIRSCEPLMASTTFTYPQQG